MLAGDSNVNWKTSLLTGCVMALFLVGCTEPVLEELPQEYASRLDWSDESQSTIITRISGVRPDDSGKIQALGNRNHACATQYSAQAKMTLFLCAVEGSGETTGVDESELTSEAEPLGEDNVPEEYFRVSVFQGRALEEPHVCGVRFGDWDASIVREQHCENIQDIFTMAIPVGEEVHWVEWHGDFDDVPEEVDELLNVAELDNSCYCCPGFVQCPSGDPEVINCKLLPSDLSDPCGPQVPQ